MMTLNLILANVQAATEAFDINGLISDLAFILILGAVTTLLFKWMKQPVVLGYIVAGFLASPHFTYLPSVTTEANIDFWAQIGIIVLLFSLGLEFSFRKLVNAGGSAVVTALFIVCGMMVAGFAAGSILGFSRINSLFLGGMLSMSSTTIIIKAFTDLNLRHRKFASLVFAVFVVGVFLLPSLLNWQRRFLNSETLLIVSMGLCLGMAVFSVACGFSLALGAFVMGSILAGTSFAERIERITVPVKDLFGSVFFISVGMMVNPTIIADYWMPIFILSGVVIVGMIFFGTFGMLLTGQSLRVAIESGFSLTQIGEFAFIIASLGMGLGVLDAQIYPIVVAVSVVTTFTTPYFIRMAPPAASWVESHMPQKLHFLIDRYSESATAEQSVVKELWRSLLKRYLWRVVLYSMVLIAMCIITQRYLIPFALGVFPNWGRLLGTVVALFLMTPFLMALTYPASKNTERKRLRECNAKFDVPLIIMTVVRLLIAMMIIVYLLSSVYSMAVGWTLGVLLFIALLMSYSKTVKARLSKIETRFIDNLNERELRRSGAKNSLVPNMHLAYMTVGYDCPFVGEQLKNSGLRSRYGVSVSSIQRGNNMIMVPAAEARVFPGDILGVIGSDEEIQALLPVVEADNDTEAPPAVDNVRLTSVRLREDSPMVGKTVVTSRLRETYEALLVAVQRSDCYIQADAVTVFAPGDVLWMVCDVDRVKDI